MFGAALAAIGATAVTRRFGFRWTPVAATSLFAADFLYPLAGGPLWLALVVLILARGLVGLGAVLGDVLDDRAEAMLAALRAARLV